MTAGVDSTRALIEAGATLTHTVDRPAAFRVKESIGDVTSALTEATISSEKLTRWEAASYFVLLATVGREITRTPIPRAQLASSETFRATSASPSSRWCAALTNWPSGTTGRSALNQSRRCGLLPKEPGIRFLRPL